MEDEDEYVDFYDFSKTYENHPLLIKKQENDSEKDFSVEQVDEEDEDGWDSVDEESLESGEDEVAADQVEIQIKEGASQDT